MRRELQRLTRLPGMDADEAWMRRALDLAGRGKGLTSPNPAVGAVLVRGGQVLGEGFHARAGGPHAEVVAIRQAHRRGHGRRLKGATLYVTLEPCSTHGRTPPCTDLILEQGIGRVVTGAVDPNPAHRGRGLRLLRRRGLAVAAGVLARECENLNRDWRHFITTGKPWVTAKIAQSLDGRIIAPEAGERWVTGPAARLAGHLLRLEADAILVGGETVRADNPRLTIRVPARHPAASRARRKAQPWRVVLTRRGNLPPDAHLFTDAHAARTIVAQDRSLPDVLGDLGNAGCVNVLLEGGGRLLGEAFARAAVHEVAFFVAPAIFGSGVPAVAQPALPAARRIPLSGLAFTPCGDDFLARALVNP